jgi:hypothetical protein
MSQLHTIRTDTYIETANSDHLLERIEHMRRLLAEKDKEISALKTIVKHMESILKGRFQ